MILLGKVQSLFKLLAISKISGIISKINLSNKENPISSTKNKFPEIAFFNISVITFILSFANFEVILSGKIPMESTLLKEGIIIPPIYNLAFKNNKLK